MEDTLLFIPPCCVDKKLPQAISQAPRRSLVFYTHGDVTLEKFYRAVSYLVVEPHVLVLTLPVVERDTVVFLSQCFERGWVSDLILQTGTDAGRYVETYLSAFRGHVVHVVSQDVSDSSSHMVLYTHKQALIINGPMLCRCRPASLVSYTAFYYPGMESFTSADYGNPLTNVLLPDVLRIRKHIRNNRIEHLSSDIIRLAKCELPPYNR